MTHKTEDAIRVVGKRGPLLYPLTDNQIKLISKITGKKRREVVETAVQNYLAKVCSDDLQRPDFTDAEWELIQDSRPSDGLADAPHGMVIPSGSSVFEGINENGPCGHSVKLTEDLPVERVLRHARMVPKDGQNVTEGWWVQAQLASGHVVFAEVE